MSCQEHAKLGQSEFEFFQQLVERPSITECCGPLVSMGFTRHSMIQFQAALAALNLAQEYLDFYDHEVLDSDHMRLTMCTKHWIQHARAIGTVAVGTSTDMWADLAYYLFRLTCFNNDWDYKEILNYTKTATELEKD